MRVEPRAATQNENSSSSTNPLSGQDDMFMQLLLAQLKSQDPMSPMDANSFVDQMVQFNTLDQITQIRQMVQTLSTAFSGDQQ